MPQYTFLTMTAGSRLGTNFSLDPTDKNRIGRDTDCDIILTDPLCSRVHCVILRERDGWVLRDDNSRNGTYVNGEKVTQALLSERSIVRVGSTEFEFHTSDHPPTQASIHTLNITQTILREAALDSPDSGLYAVNLLRDVEQSKDLLLLHQLAIKLLGVSDPDDVIHATLDLLHTRTKASVVGFLWVSDEGELKPKLVIPEDASRRVRLSEALTEVVARQGHAVWIANQTAEVHSNTLRHYADALCVPLLHDKRTIGAIHVYLEQGQFQADEFEFAISAGNIMSVALVQARRQLALEVEHKRLIDKVAAFDDLIGESQVMQSLKSRIARVARATGCVLIRGESGVGKELVARAVHKASARADRPLLSVNCAAIPPDLMESQLFGHKKGAFTGADADHTGWFQQADSGTLFLDEVGELTLDGQAKLLRILEGHPFLPVGGAKEITVDVRVIAATNRDLREFVAERRFREDLYYRLSVFELLIPPLRERGEDLELLVNHFLGHFSRQHGRPHLRLTPEARQKLLAYQWPGNVRQLRNVIDSAVVMAEGNEIQAEELGLRDASPSGLETLQIEHWERKLIQEALQRTAGNVPDAAKLLGIARATLYRKIDEYQISRT